MAIETADDIDLAKLAGVCHDFGLELLILYGSHATGQTHARDAHAIPMDLASRMPPAAGLRNRISHSYEDVDPAKVYAGLHEALKTFPEYVTAVEAYLSGSAGA